MPLTLEQRRQMAEATVSTQFETLTSAAQGCDVIVAATALQVAARSVAEKMRVPYVFAAYAPVVLPSHHHAPPPLPGQVPSMTSLNSQLWAHDAARFNDIFGAAVNARRASLGLAEISDVRSHMMTDQPWLAADATLGPWPDPTDSRVFQTGAWILSDERVWLAKGYGSFQSAWRTLEGIETVNMIRKGRVRWVSKRDVRAQARFIHNLFGIAA
jgi:vancomycin aglycone glucosyltransferase